MHITLDRWAGCYINIILDGWAKGGIEYRWVGPGVS
jgi:hypothetical protein